ncbi:carboxylesterase [Tricharina praecox]|uniref:carboxylesterase n=1 Tax=Tricharina praecox TaxID=43433 RepID=UPI00221F3D5E|nr:carboxylesterase [Tricharina praecox]KAI5843162.1 carboxylesterase [Tricharina praecox]
MVDLAAVWCYLSVAASVITGNPALCDGAPTALTITNAVVRGLVENGSYVWRGIPYAESTAGENRWKPPQPLKKKKKPSFFNATSYGYTCPQAYRDDFEFSPQDEDCLNLNIWAPSKGKKLPVFVYIYGGAMVTGSNSNPGLTGANFANKSVVYVNLNHRESVFGFPNSPELDGVQNFGIQDVTAALDWVHDNIQAFGGDPERIVLGGHSSGSVMVDHYLWTHPDTWLAGALEMSANAVSGPPYAPAGVGLSAIAAEVGCPTSGSGQLACLRKKSVAEIETATFNSTTNTWFAPVVDETTHFSSYTDRAFPTHVPLLVGSTANEGALFSYVYSGINNPFTSWIRTFDAAMAHIPTAELLAAYNTSAFPSIAAMSGQSYGDVRFECATDYMVDVRARSTDVWRYKWLGDFDNVLGIAGTGPTHGSEVPFFHGGGAAWADNIRDTVTVHQQALAESVHDWFVRWIKNPSAGPGWAKTSPGSGVVGRLGLRGALAAVVGDGESADYNDICQSLYNQYYPKFPVVQDPTKL